MDRKSFLLAVFSCLFFSAPLFAYEAFVFLGYENEGKVFRVISTDEMNSPVGYLFKCDPAANFAVDTLKNFRFLNIRENGEFKPSAGFIFRQVFDGSATEADHGKNGSQTQDQRGKILESLAARPVFRPTGAPFSAGCGKKVSENLATASFFGQEVEIFNSRNWYQIPNGSWYQSWINDGSPDKPSYRIFYDRWEERKISLIDSFWRGYVAGLAFEREGGSGVEKRLIRAEVDGAMELIEGCHELKEISRYKGHAVMHIPSDMPSEGDFYVYTWNGSMPGRLYHNGKPSGQKLFKESRDRNSRFLIYGCDSFGERRIAAIGSDTVKQWLQMKALSADNVDCSLVTSLHDPVRKVTSVYVYSSNRKCIFEIKMNEKLTGEISAIRSIEIDFEPLHLYCDSRGIVCATALECRPAELKTQDQLVAGYEALHIENASENAEKSEEQLQKEAKIKRNLHGHLVFARTHYAVLHSLFKNADTFVPNGEIFLDKDYQYCDFSLADTSLEDLYGGINDILNLTGKPGNSISKLKANAPGFPDQFKKPLSVMSAAYYEPEGF